MEERAWDFKTREEFVTFARATFVEWTDRLPEAERDAFITDVLDRCRAVAAIDLQEVNPFKFYQMQVELVPTRLNGS